MFGCEAWNLSRDSLDKLASFEMNAYRRALRVSYTTHTSNAEILNRVRLWGPTLVIFYQRRKLSYFGHVMRHNGLDRTVVYGMVPGKRRHGGQRKMWSEDVKRWLNCDFASTCRLAQDRKSFHSAVREATQG